MSLLGNMLAAAAGGASVSQYNATFTAANGTPAANYTADSGHTHTEHEWYLTGDTEIQSNRLQSKTAGTQQIIEINEFSLAGKRITLDINATAVSGTAVAGIFFCGSNPGASLSGFMVYLGRIEGVREYYLQGYQGGVWTGKLKGVVTADTTLWVERNDDGTYNVGTGTTTHDANLNRVPYGISEGTIIGLTIYNDSGTLGNTYIDRAYSEVRP